MSTDKLRSDTSGFVWPSDSVVRGDGWLHVGRPRNGVRTFERDGPRLTLIRNPTKPRGRKASETGAGDRCATEHNCWPGPSLQTQLTPRRRRDSPDIPPPDPGTALKPWKALRSLRVRRKGRATAPEKPGSPTPA